MIVDGKMPLYYHMNRLGSALVLTSGITGEEASSARYNEWGEVDADIIECGGNELDMVQRYATHDYDDVLDLYYAKARMYDAEDRRFLAVDPIKGNVSNVMTMVQYLYVLDSPLKYVDLLGLEIAYISIENSNLNFYVDTDDTKSILEMLNLFTRAKKMQNIEGEYIAVYNYTSKKTETLKDWEGISAKELLTKAGLHDASKAGPSICYFTEFRCVNDELNQYSINMPEYGSEAYLEMVNLLITIPYTSKDYSGAIERIMRDINNSQSGGISDEKFNDLAIYFANLIVMQGSVSKQEHYFRNKLNRAPQTLDDMVELNANLPEDEKWKLFPVDKSIYHMFDTEFSTNGLKNLKFVSANGLNEAVYNQDGKQCTEVTDPVNMGTFNYSNPDDMLGVSHAIVDVLPYDNISVIGNAYGNVDGVELRDNAKDNNDLYYGDINAQIYRQNFLNIWTGKGDK